jgi:hypothetical protein
MLQSLDRAFGRAFGRAFVELYTEPCAELLQSFCRAFAELLQNFCRALVELNVLKFITWILPQLTARNFFSNQSEAGLAKFEIQDPKI